MIFHFKVLRANLRSGKGGTFVVGLERHLAWLRRWVQYFRQQSIFADFTINCQKIANTDHVCWVTEDGL